MCKLGFHDLREDILYFGAICLVLWSGWCYIKIYLKLWAKEPSMNVVLFTLGLHVIYGLKLRSMLKKKLYNKVLKYVFQYVIAKQLALFMEEQVIGLRNIDIYNFTHYCLWEFNAILIYVGIYGIIISNPVTQTIGTTMIKYSKQVSIPSKIKKDLQKKEKELTEMNNNIKNIKIKTKKVKEIKMDAKSVKSAIKNNHNNLDTTQQNIDKLCDWIESINSKLIEETNELQVKRDKIKTSEKNIKSRTEELNKMINEYNTLVKDVQKIENKHGNITLINDKYTKLIQKCEKIIDEHWVYINSNKDFETDLNYLFENTYKNMEKEWWNWDDIKLAQWCEYKLLKHDLNEEINWNKVKKDIKIGSGDGMILKSLVDNVQYIKLLGIDKIESCIFLHKYIKNLIDRYPQNNDNNINNQTNKPNIIDKRKDDVKMNDNVPNKYICPISGK